MLNNLRRELKSDPKLVELCKKHPPLYLRVVCLVVILICFNILMTAFGVTDDQSKILTAIVMVIWVTLNTLADIGYVLVMGVDEDANKNRN